MLQLKSILNVIDNSGAVWAECIRVLHGGKYARIGKFTERLSLLVFDAEDVAPRPDNKKRASLEMHASMVHVPELTKPFLFFCLFQKSLTMILSRLGNKLLYSHTKSHHRHVFATHGKYQLMDRSIVNIFKPLGKTHWILLPSTFDLMDRPTITLPSSTTLLQQQRNQTDLTGDEIVVVVNKAKANAVATASGVPKVKKGDVRHALVVRARKETMRPDGRYVRFDDNACVLLNKQGEPLGTRVLGVVSGELRQKRWMKLLSLAPKVV